MVFIQGSSYIQGSDDFDDSIKVEKDSIPKIAYKKHAVEIDSFYISKYEITVREFYDFIDDTAYETFAKREWLTWIDNNKHPHTYNSQYRTKKYEKYPITEITHEDALEYCKWLSKKTGKRFRLPTECEWEYIASSGKANKYPWGNEYKIIHNGKLIDDFLDVNYDEDVLPVTETENDKSNFNVCGIFGNVRELCLDRFDPLFYLKDINYNPLQIYVLYPSDTNTYRGFAGYNMNKPDSCKITKRFSTSDNYYSSTLGFRIVQEESETVFNKNTDTECIYNYTTGIINDDYINMRYKPSLQSEKRGHLMKGDKIIIYFRTAKKTKIDTNEDYWFFIKKLNPLDVYSNQAFWIFGKYIDFS